MLNIKVELWPYGDPTKSREIASFRITNKTPIKLRNGDFTLDHRLGGLRDLIDEALAYTPPPPPAFKFSTYEWLNGSSRACIRRIADNTIVAANWPDTSTADEKWKAQMVELHSTSYPGIYLP